MKRSRLTTLLLLILFSLHGGICAGSDLFKPIDEFLFIKDPAADFQPATPLSNIQPASSSGDKNLLEMGLLHKYLGYGTLLLAAAAGLSGSDSSTHHNLAVGATTLGALTVASGYYEYGDMFQMDEGLSRSNLHIALGTLGAIGFAAEAVIASTDSSHGGLGIASAAAMGAALIIVVW
jgi:hypothetical protein